MKKILIFSIIFIVFVFIIPYFIKGDYEYTDVDCAESGICKEGTEYYINDKKILIFKETCLEYGKEWIENKKACIMR